MLTRDEDFNAEKMQGKFSTSSYIDVIRFDLLNSSFYKNNINNIDKISIFKVNNEKFKKIIGHSKINGAE